MTPSSDPTRARLGARIRSERERLGWTQERLTEEVRLASYGNVNLARSTLARLEAGEREPRLEEGVYLAQALGVPLVALLAPDSDDLAVRAQRLVVTYSEAEADLVALSARHRQAQIRLADLEAQAESLMAEGKRRGEDLSELARALERWKSPF